MTFYISALNYDRPRIQEPTFVDKINVRQRTYDSHSETWDTTQGNAFTIERLMPVPYELTINLDIWTSNTNQKLQILEQILTLFNPSLELQSTDNFIDWTSLSVIYLDSVNWTSRTIPVGTENPIDICTLKFTLPIWISSPAKLKKLGVVERVIASIYDAQGDAANAITDNDLLLGTRQLITPWNYKLVVIENKIQCLYAPTIVPDGSLDTLVPTQIVADSSLLWPTLISAYGVERPGISQIRLDQPDGSVIVGTFIIDPNDDRLLIYDIDPDTAPANTLPPIDAIINPLVSSPGNGLPTPVTGTRYLLTESTGSYDNVDTLGHDVNPTGWLGNAGQPLVAQADDIIQWNGNRWVVVFVAADQTAAQWVTNITTGTQYEYVPGSGTEGGNVIAGYWQKSYQGVYPGGTWSIVL